MRARLQCLVRHQACRRPDQSPAASSEADTSSDLDESCRMISIFTLPTRPAIAAIAASQGAVITTTPPATAPAVSGTERKTSPPSDRICSFLTFPSAMSRLTSSTSWWPTTSTSSVKVYQEFLGCSSIGLLLCWSANQTPLVPRALDPPQTASRWCPPAAVPGTLQSPHRRSRDAPSVRDDLRRGRSGRPRWASAAWTAKSRPPGRIESPLRR